MSDRFDKEITLNQLRSFVETARRGSFTAAAEALDLSQPTIWKQVHELERLLGVQLIRTNQKGCELTAEGAILEKLAAPNIVNVLNLPSRFRATIAEATIPIRIAASPRPLAEDIVPQVAGFVKANPRVRFSLIEAPAEVVPNIVDQGQAELGFTLVSSQIRSKFPLLSIKPWYELDVLLVLPPKHPLCRKRKITLGDLKPYPLIGTRSMIEELPGSEQIMALELDQTEPRWVEARHSAVVRSCVRQKLGIALLLGREGQSEHTDLVEYNLTNYLGPATMYLVKRQDVIHDTAVDAFADSIRQTKRKK